MTDVQLAIIIGIAIFVLLTLTHWHDVFPKE
jgi:hypothetical protein